MKTHPKNKLRLAVCTLLTTTSLGVSATPSAPTIHHMKANGAPAFMSGNLGNTNIKSAKEKLKAILAAESSYGLQGSEQFDIARQWTDALGKTHVRFKQRLNGLKVYGTSMSLHLDNTASTINTLTPSGDVYAVTGALGVDANPIMSKLIQLRNDRGIQALSKAKTMGKVRKGAELAYVYLPETGELSIAWKTRVTYNDDFGHFQDDIVFLDVMTNEVLARHPQVHSAKVHNTYDMNNEPYSSFRRPGTLVCSTGQSCADASAQRAHTGASIVYDTSKIDMVVMVLMIMV